MKLTPPPVKVAALELGLPVWQPETMRGAESDPRLAGHDLFVVMAYGEILRQPVLSLPKACINLHASLLPRWRGASPLQACLRAGDSETGVCVMEMVPALDAGPVYLTERIPLTPTTTLPELHDQVASSASQALMKFLHQWPTITAAPQDPTVVTMCRKLRSEDGRVDWSQEAAAIERHVRAYTPNPGCWTLLGAERVRLIAVSTCFASVAAGSIQIDNSQLIVGCGQGAIRIDRLQPAGKSVMSGTAFIAGRPSL